MIVNKVVLLISPARAREEELISQSAALVFAWLHCRPPRELAAEWTSLNSVGGGGPVGVRSAASPLFSPSAPRQKHSAATNNRSESMLLEKGFTSHDVQAAGGRLIIQHVWKMMHSHGKHLISLKVSL